ncbi:hypothetical protein AAFF_G00222910 [Aldrovandia affinis]|uniref:Uncharacterized protein n=1 Tax=Aldrovandia affinis TaxID=143900 RepID=A0AAD7W4L6_9TELE|nr:hypothetical protein AAFF_G00222910 [Aldrovandia affinis]
MYGSTQIQSHMCDQDQCIQSTKFVLQAASTPLLHSEPVAMSGEPPLPGRTSLGGHCASLAPGHHHHHPPTPTTTPLPSTASGLCWEGGSDHHHHHHYPHPHPQHHHHHHLRIPDETPTPPGMLPCSQATQLYDPASMDSLHEDSVRGLVKLSSV